MSSVAVTLPPDSTSVPAARRFLRETLDTWDADAYSWTASQVLSELVTNAVLHAGTPFTVTVTLRDDVLRLAVSDASPRVPRQRHYGTEATTGRGVSLVASLSRSWGVEPGSTGKTVWCDLASGAGAEGCGDAEALSLLDAWGELDDLAGGREPTASAPAQSLHALHPVALHPVAFSPRPARARYRVTRCALRAAVPA